MQGNTGNGKTCPPGPEEGRIEGPCDLASGSERQALMGRRGSAAGKEEAGAPLPGPSLGSAPHGEGGPEVRGPGSHQASLQGTGRAQGWSETGEPGGRSGAFRGAWCLALGAWQSPLVNE